MLESADKVWLSRLLGPNVHYEESMAKHTSFRIGGPADAFAQPESEDQLKAILEWTQAKTIAYMLIGGGTNLLVRDGGIRGLVIHLGRMNATIEWVQKQQRITVSAGAGVPTRRICARALRHGWQGMNFALGIPGTIGGAVLMNAGTARGAMADVIESVTLMTGSGDKVEWKRKQLAGTYRCLQLPDNVAHDPAAPGAVPVLLSCTLALTLGNREQIRRQARRWMRERSQRQPAWQPSAGCFFKNPAQDVAAGRLIDEAGLKGFQVGGARVSPRHANFIINCGGASAADVLTLKDKIQEAVKSRFGIDLVPEVRIVGEEKTGA
jgi:UDP-N-acetylmuramate dehydrogenase